MRCGFCERVLKKSSTRRRYFTDPLLCGDCQIIADLAIHSLVPGEQRKTKVNILHQENRKPLNKFFNNIMEHSI